MSRCSAAWREDVLDEINALLSLEPNWDSYGAQAIDGGCTGKAAVFVLLLAEHKKLPRPSVVPTSGGGVQIEWCIDGLDIELNIELAPINIGDEKSNETQG